MTSYHCTCTYTISNPNNPCTCEKHENVSRWFGKVYLHDSDECSVKVVSLRLPSVEDVHRVGAARDGEDGL